MPLILDACTRGGVPGLQPHPALLDVHWPDWIREIWEQLVQWMLAANVGVLSGAAGGQFLLQHKDQGPGMHLPAATQDALLANLPEQQRVVFEAVKDIYFFNKSNPSNAPDDASDARQLLLMWANNV